MGAGVVVNAGWADRGTTWDASNVQATGWIPALSESLTEAPEITRSAALGQVSQYQGELTRLSVAGDLVAEYDYNYGHGLLKYALGAEAAGTYSTTNTLAMPFVALEIDKGVSRWRYGCCAVNRLVISGTPNQVIQLTYGVVSYVEARLATAFPAIRPAASLQERAVFEHATLQLGPTGSALGAGNLIGVSGFEITLENNLVVDQVSSASQRRVLSPQRNGFRTGTLRLDFPRYLAGLETGGTHPLNTWRQSHTQLQAKLVLTGLSGSLTIHCPILHLSEGANANVSGPETIAEGATFTLEGGVNADLAGDQLHLIAA